MSPHVTISLGVATIHPSDGESTSELFSRADTVLYEAKWAGRNRVEVSEKKDE